MCVCVCERERERERETDRQTGGREWRGEGWLGRAKVARMSEVWPEGLRTGFFS